MAAQVSAELRLPACQRVVGGLADIVSKGQFQFVERNVQVHRHLMRRDIEHNERGGLLVRLRSLRCDA